MIKELHIASQYLAAAGISFVDKQDDDSHTNLGWDTHFNRLTSHPLNFEGVQLALGFEEFALLFLNGEKEISKLELLNKNHGEVLNWISTQLEQLGFTSEYNYTFHYNIGYEEITSEYVFSHHSKPEAADFGGSLTIAQNSFEKFLSSNKLESPIRIWPHHFDLGIYTLIAENLYMGAGLAIPDTISKDLYFYSSGYLNGKTVGNQGFEKLFKGEWGKGGFNGAVLENVGVNEEQAVEFINSTKNYFLENTIS